MESERKTVVLVTSSDWNEAPRLRHQMAKKLLEWYRLVWIQVPTSNSPEKKTLTHPTPNLTVLQLAKRSRLIELLWDNIPVFHRYFNRFLLKEIRSSLERLDFENINLITFQINFVEVLDLRQNGFSIYVCNDPFPSYRRKYHKRLFESYEAQIAKKVDVSLAVSDPLVQQLKNYSPNVKLFLPGHDIKISGEYEQTTSKEVVLTYMGFIDKRINYDWIKSFLREYPQIKMRFIGPIKSVNEVAELKEFSNVEFVPSVTGQMLFKELSKSNVLLLPFKGDNITVQYMSAPNKLFQYLVTGRPIVSCKIPALVELPNKCVYQSEDYSQFATNILKAIDEDNADLGKMRIEVAMKNSWANRGKELRSIIDNI